MSDTTFDEYSLYTEGMSVKDAYDRSKLKLDFGSAISSTKRNSILAGTPISGSLLQSPDLMLLKLGSPELENLIMQNNGLITTTPTPTDSSISDQSTVEEREQFAAGFVRALQKLQQTGETYSNTLDISSSYLLSRSHTQSSSQSYTSQDCNANTVAVKEERIEPKSSCQIQNRPSGISPPQSWVKTNANTIRGGQAGVIRSHERQQVASRPTCGQATLQNQQRLSHVAASQSSVVRYASQQQHPNAGLITRNVASTSNVYPTQNAVSLPRSIQQSGISNYHGAIARSTQANSSYPVISSVGSASSSPRPPPYKIEDEAQIVPSNTPPLQSTPIDLKMQEIIKHERKKLRNRLAAQRCRKRKIEKEEELKDKVKELKLTNTELTTTRSELKKQVIELKQKVMNHVNMGCHVFLPKSGGVATESHGSTITEL